MCAEIVVAEEVIRIRKSMHKSQDLGNNYTKITLLFDGWTWAIDFRLKRLSVNIYFIYLYWRIIIFLRARKSFSMRVFLYQSVLMVCLVENEGVWLTWRTTATRPPRERSSSAVSSQPRYLVIRKTFLHTVWSRKDAFFYWYSIFWFSHLAGKGLLLIATKWAANGSRSYTS